MREILFRGKSICTDSPNDEGPWLEGYLVRKKTVVDDAEVYTYHIISDVVYDLDLDSDSEVWPETVGQFTGLMDKNGKKIFEGDIIDASSEDYDSLGFNSKIEVAFDKFCGGFIPFSVYDGDCGKYIIAKCCEVVGNIHDDPDLQVKIS